MSVCNARPANIMCGGGNRVPTVEKGWMCVRTLRSQLVAQILKIGEDVVGQLPRDIAHSLVANVICIRVAVDSLFAKWPEVLDAFGAVCAATTLKLKGYYPVIEAAWDYEVWLPNSWWKRGNFQARSIVTSSGLQRVGRSLKLTA